MYPIEDIEAAKYQGCLWNVLGASQHTSEYQKLSPTL
jgi:hypothetical protein